MSSRKWRKINAYGSYEVYWSPWGQMEPGTGQMLPDNWNQLPVGNEPESFFCVLPTTLTWVQSTKIPWRRKWQPTSVFLPGEFHGQRSLAGYNSWDCKSRTGLMCKREVSGTATALATEAGLGDTADAPLLSLRSLLDSLPSQKHIPWSSWFISRGNPSPHS